MKIIKNSFIYAVLMLVLVCPALAQGVIEGGIQLDWPLVNQEERTKAIEYYRDLLFKDVVYRIDKEKFAEHRKDPNAGDNRFFLKNGIKIQPDRELAGFYLLDKVLYMYGVKYYEDKYNIYYYNAVGGLELYDVLDRPHDVYPRIAYQYRKNGKLAGASYYISEYDQYIFDAKGRFKGRWYGSRLYDKKAKVIMTRELPY